LIVVARLVEKKGIRYAIAAVARVLASGRDVQCDIVGDGPLYAELECYIRECALESHVRLLGWKSHAEVVKLLETAHVLLAPSVTAEDTDEEGIPNSMKEAMALGLPVIATRHGGIPELLEDGASGYLVPERDVDALADRIAAVADDPDVWFDMGTAGRRRVESEYDIDTLTHELVRMYREAALAAAMPVRIATPPLFSEGKTP
jgi:colanic acid/amylovoran biosynthesis glycosyltransferase